MNRRDFLRTIPAVVASALLPKWVQRDVKPIGRRSPLIYDGFGIPADRVQKRIISTRRLYIRYDDAGGVIGGGG